VVAVKVGGQIKWSWHIWNVGYTSDLAAITANTNSGEFMDRNLGATTIELDHPGSKGLFYQWGRKDPFPGSTTIAGTGEPTLYTQTGSFTYGSANKQVGPVDIATSILNPLTFYTGTDWTTPSNNTLWSPSSKTAYDPCPAGYKVPAGNPYGGLGITFTDDTFPETGSYHARTYTGNEFGAQYPTSGWRTEAAGALTNVGTTGFYTTGAVWSGNNFAYLMFRNGQSNVQGGSPKARGCPVRCVKE
jgi:hypothetical protein